MALTFFDFFIFSTFVAYCTPFECMTCNNRPEEDDTLQCVDRFEKCHEGVKSCSTVMFRSMDDKLHTRKFCTSTGTPIYQYLMFFPGSALCQNIETVNAPSDPLEPMIVPGPNGTKITVFPPAPPSQQISTFLCVCTKERCNKGSVEEVMDRTMMQNLNLKASEKKLSKPPGIFVEKFAALDKLKKP